LWSYRLSLRPLLALILCPERCRSLLFANAKGNFGGCSGDGTPITSNTDWFANTNAKHTPALNLKSCELQDALQGKAPTMNFRRFIHQLLGIRDNSIVPAVCYATCSTSVSLIQFPDIYRISKHVLTINSDNAYIEAQKVGLSDALCTPGSAFELDYTTCQTCIIANSNSTNVSVTTYTDPEFASFLSFCNNQTNSSNNASISSQLSLLSAVSTVEVALSSKGSEGLVSTVTQTQTQTVIFTSVSIVTVGGVSSATSGQTSSFILNVRGVAC
jgi:hypothetical protein